MSEHVICRVPGQLVGYDYCLLNTDTHELMVDGDGLIWYTDDPAVAREMCEWISNEGWKQDRVTS